MNQFDSFFQYPFGRPLLSTRRSPAGKKPVFILGAYPSALHIKWIPPTMHIVKALAVDNEPEPFWDGSGELGLIENWKKQVGFQEEWGDAIPTNGFNGTSGSWLAEQVLKPLEIQREEAWITDCLYTYRLSARMKKRIGDTYRPIAGIKNLPPSNILPHPSEDTIVYEVLSKHLPTLREEVEAVEPDLVVTLGNAASRVFSGYLTHRNENRDPALLPTEGKERVLSVRGYWRRLSVRLWSMREANWLPLAHPAAPRPYQTAHLTWLQTLKRF